MSVVICLGPRLVRFSSSALAPPSCVVVVGDVCRASSVTPRGGSGSGWVLKLARTIARYGRVDLLYIDELG